MEQHDREQPAFSSLDHAVEEFRQKGDVKAPPSLLPTVMNHLGLGQNQSRAISSLESLVVALESADWHERATTVRALGELKEDVLLEPLLAALDDEDESVRATAVIALGKRRGTAATDQLVMALHDPAWLVRETAVLALGNLGELTVVEHLGVVLDDENEFVREAAQRTLQQARTQALSTNTLNTPFKSQGSLNQLISRMKRSFTSGATEEAELQNGDTSLSHTEDQMASRQSVNAATFHAPQRPPALTKPRRRLRIIVEGILTALVVIGIVAAWLLLLPKSHLSTPSAGKGLIIFTYHDQGSVSYPAWSSDGRYMDFVDKAGNVYSWDSVTKKLMKTFTLPYLPSDPKLTGEWTWAPDGRYLVNAREDGRLQVWDATMGRRILTYISPTPYWVSWGWSPDSKRIALVGNFGKGVAEVWDVTTGQRILNLAQPVRDVFEFDWSPDGQRIASLSRERIIQIWDARTGAELQSIYDPALEYVVWSPDGQRIVSISDYRINNDKSLRVWDVATGRKLLTFTGHADSYGAFTTAWSVDGKRIMSASVNEVLVWDASTGHIILNIPNGDSSYLGIPELSPDGKLLEYNNGGNTVQIWNAVTGKKILTYQDQNADVLKSGVVWSPDSRNIALVDTAGIVQVWNAITGHILITFNVNSSAIESLAWSPNGKMIGVTGGDGTVAVLRAP
jgi:WD40 repeat protein